MSLHAASKHACTKCATVLPIDNFLKECRQTRPALAELDPNATAQRMKPSECYNMCSKCRDRERTQKAAARQAKRQKTSEANWLRYSWNDLCRQIETGYSLKLHVVDAKRIRF